jgi:hypothetical protein
MQYYTGSGCCAQQQQQQMNRFFSQHGITERFKILIYSYTYFRPTLDDLSKRFICYCRQVKTLLAKFLLAAGNPGSRMWDSSACKQVQADSELNAGSRPGSSSSSSRSGVPAAAGRYSCSIAEAGELVVRHAQAYSSHCNRYITVSVRCCVTDLCINLSMNLPRLLLQKPCSMSLAAE